MKLPLCLALAALAPPLIAGPAASEEPGSTVFHLRYGDSATVFASSLEGSEDSLPVFRICNKTQATVSHSAIKVLILPVRPVSASHPLAKTVELARFECVFAKGGQIELQTDPVFAEGSLTVAIDGPEGGSIEASVMLIPD